MPEASHPTEDVLAIHDLHAWYGESHVLHGLSMGARQGEVVTMLGRNGAGKTTTLKAIMGIVRQRTGSVKFEGRELIKERAFRVARQGIAAAVDVDVAAREAATLQCDVGVAHAARPLRYPLGLRLDALLVLVAL